MNEPIVSAPTPAPSQPTTEISSEDKTMALLAHLLGIATWFVGALIIWLIKKDQSKFVDHHGKEALNFQITFTIAWIASAVLSIVGIGCLLFPIIWVLDLVFCVIATIAASKGEWYKYPVSIRFVK